MVKPRAVTPELAAMMSDTRILTTDELAEFKEVVDAESPISSRNFVRLLDHIDAQREELLGVLQTLNRVHATMMTTRGKAYGCPCVFCERYRELKGQAVNV